jgi:four helix bundle protein
MRVQSYRELDVYGAAFKAQQDIFRDSKAWPAEERYALTDQIRRSSRSIGANIAEAWAKRRYPAHFLSKCTDADGELQETTHWLDTAKACGYLTEEAHANFVESYRCVGRMLGSVIKQHEAFCD